MAYQKNKNGKTVKFDKDPTNDYSDGYNAGRRYKTQKKGMYWVLVIILLLAVALAFYNLGNINAEQSESVTPANCVKSVKEDIKTKVDSVLPDTGGK